MRLAGGWQIYHLSDRVVELRKDSYEYRRLTGRDGFVRVRAEPGMKRADMIDRALHLASENDTALSFRIAHDLIPTAVATKHYRDQIKALAPSMATPEEPELIGVKKA